jgi:hypothetical protein
MSYNIQQWLYSADRGATVWCGVRCFRLLAHLAMPIASISSSALNGGHRTHIFCPSAHLAGDNPGSCIAESAVNRLLAAPVGHGSPKSGRVRWPKGVIE